MRASLRKSAALAAVAAGSLALAGAAQAATTIGSDLATSPTSGFQDHTATQVAAPASPNPIAAPAGGVLVRIRLRYGRTDANPGTVAFRVLSGANPFTARPATVDGGELRFPLLANLPAGTDDYVDYRPVDAGGRPVGIPIAAGERLGLAQLTPGAARVSAPAGLTTIVAFADGQQLSGSAPYTQADKNELALQGVIEPDADGDLRGDETQDQCPALPNDPVTGWCPPQLVIREIVKEVPVSRCKVPPLRGLTRSFASRLLSASGCRLGAVRAKLVRRGPRGRVIGQSARAGTIFAAGARVGVTLSRRVTRGGRG